VSHWLLHWLGMDNPAGPVYLGLSGFVGDLTLLAGLVAFVAHAVVSYRHKNCHVRRCPRIAHLPVEGTPWRVCRKHSPAGAPTHQDVITAHKVASSARGDRP
jgi:hypothetical protein